MPDTQLPPAEQPDAAHTTHANPASGPASKTAVTPVMAMAVAIVAILVILLGIRLKTPNENQKLAPLRAELEALKRHSGALGQPALAGGEQIEDIAERMKKDAEGMVLLAARYKQLLDEARAALATKATEVLRLEQYRQLLGNDYERAKTELQQAKASGSEAAALRSEVDTLKTQREAQVAELAALKQQLAAVGEQAPKADLDSLQRRFEETLRAKEFFESRAKELETELGKARLFARSENELLPAAVKLFGTLRKLENQPDSDISKTYSQIGADLAAAVVKTLTFPTGSAKLGPADEDPVRRLVDTVPDGDLLLVIGYASETGNVDANRTLSSARATAVAELLTSVKRPGQLVQAVYLGQTDRFSSRAPERNQLVEVWHIRKQQ